MSTTIQPVPPAVLASEFPSLADRPAGTYNAKAKAWADSENAMALRTREIAVSAHHNASAAKEYAEAAGSRAADAETAKHGAEDARDAASRHGQEAADAADSAWAAAVAAGTGAGLPTPLVPGKVLGVNAAGTAAWIDAVRVGDIIVSSHSPGPGWLETGNVYLKSAYPALAAHLGNLPNRREVVLQETGLPSAAPRGLRWITSDIVLVSAGNAIFRSIDAGVTWSRIESPAGATSLYGIVRVSDSVVLALGEGAVKLIRSTDGGATWSNATAALPSSIAQLRVGVFVDGDAILFGTDSSAIYTDSIRSSDGGVTWSAPVRVGNGNNPAATTLDQDVVVIVGQGSTPSIYRSVDRGATWTLPESFSGVSGSWAVGAADGVLVFAGSSGGVLVSRPAYNHSLRAQAPTPGSGSFNGVASAGSAFFLTSSNGTIVTAPTSDPSEWSLYAGRPTTPPVSFGPTEVSPDGALLLPGSSSMNFVIGRPTDIYDYDTATQFYVPPAAARAPYNALIKAS